MGILDFFSGKKQPKSNDDNREYLLEKTEVADGLSIPRAFALQWPEIAKTRLPYISIKARPSNDLALEQSKFGHYPCLPADFDYPKDDNGNFMYPLAQINFRECGPLPGYPSSGYLQFYIAAFDDVYGIDFDDQQLQKNFRVLYFEEAQVEKYKADFSFLDEVLATDRVPVYKPHALEFKLKDDYIGPQDVRYEQNPILDKIAEQYPAAKDELEDAIYESFPCSGHKIGGYAYFTQQDPRSYRDGHKDYILLFQIDTDDEIMWGDSGVANFFIDPDDLAKKDFSKVFYNWDCC